MVAPSCTLAAPADPKEIAINLLPRRPSVSIEATESCLMISLVELSRSITTVILSLGRCGNSILCTVPR